MDIPDMPEALRRRALLRGNDGEAWLTGLKTMLSGLAAEWDLSLGRAFGGGTEALVIEAVTADARPAVLKVVMAGGDPTARELRTLLVADGRGYAQVLRHDRARGAMLLERLGPQLHELGLSIEAQIEIICANLMRTWAPPPPGETFPTGAEKAAELGSYIETAWRALGKPCSERAVERSLAFVEARANAFDPATAVLGHGDAHAWNTLQAPGPDPFKFIDPDGLVIERAHDLSISMREWSDELLAGDPLELGLRRCRQLAALTGVEPTPIWQWAMIERVSNGLLIIEEGIKASGPDFLAVADAWAVGDGP